MIRIPIFLLIGPTVGLLAEWLKYLMTSGTVDRIGHDVSSLFVVLPLLWLFSLYFGFLPAISAMLADVVLAKYGIKSWKRYTLAGLAGYCATYLLLPTSERFFIESHIPSFGLMGGVAGFVCSWLSSKVARGWHGLGEDR